MGVKTNYEYHTPASVDEALTLLDEYQDEARVISGGTDLIPKIKAGIKPFSHLISLREIDQLNYIHFDRKEGVRIGTRVPLRVCEADKDIRTYYPALYEGMHSMANTQVRNRGTIAGNICNAIPSADTAPALLVYHAVVKACSVNGERDIPIDEFFTGVGKTCLKPDELVTEIYIPLPDPDATSLYYKYAIRKALDLAMIGVAVNVSINHEKVVKDASIALGAVAVTPKRALNAEKALVGNPLTDDLIIRAAQIASQEDCAPITDIRATAEYRRKMVFIRLRDALRKVVGE